MAASNAAVELPGGGCPGTRDRPGAPRGAPRPDPRVLRVPPARLGGGPPGQRDDPLAVPPRAQRGDRGRHPPRGSRPLRLHGRLCAPARELRVRLPARLRHVQGTELLRRALPGRGAGPLQLQEAEDAHRHDRRGLSAALLPGLAAADRGDHGQQAGWSLQRLLHPQQRERQPGVPGLPVQSRQPLGAAAPARPVPALRGAHARRRDQPEHLQEPAARRAAGPRERPLPRAQRAAGARRAARLQHRLEPFRGRRAERAGARVPGRAHAGAGTRGRRRRPGHGRSPRQPALGPSASGHRSHRPPLRHGRSEQRGPLGRHAERDLPLRRDPRDATERGPLSATAHHPGGWLGPDRDALGGEPLPRPGCELDPDHRHALRPDRLHPRARVRLGERGGARHDRGLDRAAGAGSRPEPHPAVRRRQRDGAAVHRSRRA